MHVVRHLTSLLDLLLLRSPLVLTLQQQPLVARHAINIAVSAALARNKGKRFGRHWLGLLCVSAHGRKLLWFKSFYVLMCEFSIKKTDHNIKLPVHIGNSFNVSRRNL